MEKKTIREEAIDKLIELTEKRWKKLNMRSNILTRDFIERTQSDAIDITKKITISRIKKEIEKQGIPLYQQTFDTKLKGILLAEGNWKWIKDNLEKEK